MAIHPTAVIDPKADIDPSVEIGPYVIIEGPVKIGANTTVRAHAFINGWTEIGERCDIHPFTVVGHYPQDFHYHGERSYCKIGNGVIIREGATVHRGTQPESSTIIGDECFLLAYAHVGHNCILGRGVKAYNMTAVSGHAEIGDNAIISGYGLIHQFVRIGKLAFISGTARVKMDVPPFMTAFGESTIVQYNIVGMRRAGYSKEDIAEIRQAHRILYRSGQLFSKSIAQLADTVKTKAGKELLEFLQHDSDRGFCVGGISHRIRTQAGDQDDTDEG